MRSRAVMRCTVLLAVLAAVTPVVAQEVSGVEHWVEQAGLKLSVWEKYLGSPTGKPVVILAHGSATAGRESFDLQVPGQPSYSLMDVLAREGFDDSMWYYLYRAVDKHGQTIDFLLSEHRDAEAALRFLKKAIRRNGLPEKITIDGSDANAAAIKSYNEAHGTTISIRQVKDFNNIVEQDQRGVKRITRPMLGFKAFDAAQATLVGIELMHMIKKRQMVVEAGEEGLTAAALFYSLAA